MYQEIPQTITITLSTQEVSNAISTIATAIELTSIKSGHTVLADNLTELYKKIWDQFVDQVVSITDPKLYQMIVDQRRQQQ